MTTENTSDTFLPFASSICHALAEGLTQTCNVAWQCGPITTSPSSASLQGAQEIYRLTLGSLLEGRAFLAVMAREGSAAEAGTPTGTVAASIQIMQQRLKTLLRQHVGDVKLSIDTAQAEDVPADGPVQLQADLHSEEVQLTVHILFDAALAESLRQPNIGRLLKALVPVAPVHTNLDLVMDVALSVSLRFGRRQLPLREVIELTSGSVVELDRQVDEPVELVLDGRVVARGEAVIIDGNYGMRVTQIVQPLLNV